jgi:excisionase family DNA binding protein
MSILSPTDRAVLWRTAVTSGPKERSSLLRVLAAEILASVGRRLDLYGGYEDEVIETVEILDRAGLLGRDDLREAFEEADEDEDHAETFTALLITHLGAAADIERLGVELRLKAVRLAGAWQLHIADRTQAERQWLTAAQVAAKYGVTPQAVYKWISAGRILAEQTPGGSWRLPADQFTREHTRPDATTQLKAQLLARAADSPAPADEELAAEIVARRRS